MFCFRVVPDIIIGCAYYYAGAFFVVEEVDLPFIIFKLNYIFNIYYGLDPNQLSTRFALD